MINNLFTNVITNVNSSIGFVWVRSQNLNLVFFYKCLALPDFYIKRAFIHEKISLFGLGAVPFF